MTGNGEAPAYGQLARALHWWMAGLVLFQLAIGFIMTYQGPEGNIWGRIAGALQLYDLHKVLGIVLLALVLVRLANRVLVSPPPPHAPGLAAWQHQASELVHAWIYLLLVTVPLLGWLGISMYPALVVFGSIRLPGLVGVDQKLSEAVFIAHKAGAIVLGVLIALHFAAALFHHLVLRDGLLARMLPGLGKGRR